MLHSPKNELVDLKAFYAAQSPQPTPKKPSLLGACCGAATNAVLCGLPRRIARDTSGDVFKFNCHNSKSNELMSFQLITVRPLSEMMQAEFIGN